MMLKPKRTEIRTSTNTEDPREDLAPKRLPIDLGPSSSRVLRTPNTEAGCLMEGSGLPFQEPLGKGNDTLAETEAAHSRGRNPRKDLAKRKGNHS